MTLYKAYQTTAAISNACSGSDTTLSPKNAATWFQALRGKPVTFSKILVTIIRDGAIYYLWFVVFFVQLLYLTSQ